MSGRPLLRVICFRLDVAKGMERAVASIVPRLAETYDVELVVLRRGIAPVLTDTARQACRVELVRAEPVRFARVALRRQGGDIDLVVGLWAALVWPPLWRHGKRPRMIVWDHSLLPSRLHQDNRLRWLWPLIRRAYRRADRVVCVSRASAEFVRAEVDREGAVTPAVSVIPNVVPPPRITTPQPTRGSAVQLVCIGQLSAIKNHRLAIDAMVHLPNEWQLTCLGDGPERRSLEQRAAQLGIADRVHLRGFVEDVSAHLDNADVLVHPSLAETFCLAAFEAANHGVPVACLAQGSLADSVPTYIVGQTAPISANAREFAATIQGSLAMRRDEAAFEAAARRRRELTLDEVWRLWRNLLSTAPTSR